MLYFEANHIKSSIFRAIGLLAFGHVVATVLVIQTKFAPMGKGHIGYPPRSSTQGVSEVVYLLNRIPLIGDLLDLSIFIATPTPTSLVIFLLSFLPILIGMWTFERVFANRLQILSNVVEYRY